MVGFGGVGFTADLGVSSDTQSGNVSFDSAPVYGGLVGFQAQRHGYAYLSYSRMETTAYFRPAGGFETSRQTDVSFDYLQVGGNLEAPHGRVVPYLGLSLGATRLAPVEGSGNDFSFSGVLDGGVKIMLTRVPRRTGDRAHALELHQWGSSGVLRGRSRLSRALFWTAVAARASIIAPPVDSTRVVR